MQHINTISTTIHVWYLEMTTQPASQAHDDVKNYELKRVGTPLPELNRFLYATVGGPWKWYMRLDWSWKQWSDYLAQPTIETWVAYQHGTPVGYFELNRQHNGDTEIVYFGLIPEYVGKGLGKIFLSDCIQRAWMDEGLNKSKRIWLHTCTLDHPNALPNYLNRGFKVYKEEDFVDTVPADPLQPWPDAAKPISLPTPRTSGTPGN